MTRRELEKKIARKEQEISELERQVHDARIYVQAWQDVLRLLPREEAGAVGESTLRSGSVPSKAQDAIRKAGKPLHVVELLRAMGMPTDRKARGGVSGTLSPYVRRGEVFTRPAPNTFGLKELDSPGGAENPAEGEDGPPDSFGADDGESESAAG